MKSCTRLSVVSLTEALFRPALMMVELRVRNTMSLLTGAAPVDQLEVVVQVEELPMNTLFAMRFLLNQIHVALGHLMGAAHVGVERDHVGLRRVLRIGDEIPNAGGHDLGEEHLVRN